MKQKKKNNVAIDKKYNKSKGVYEYTISKNALKVSWSYWQFLTETVKHLIQNTEIGSFERTGHWNECLLHVDEEKFTFEEFKGWDADHYFNLVPETNKELKRFKNSIKETKKEKNLKKETKIKKTNNSFFTFKGIPDYTKPIEFFKKVNQYDVKILIGKLLFYNKNYEREPFLNNNISFNELKEIGVPDDQTLRSIHSTSINNLNVDNLINFMKEENYNHTISKKDIHFKIISKGEIFTYYLNSKKKISCELKFLNSSFSFIK